LRGENAFVDASFWQPISVREAAQLERTHLGQEEVARILAHLFFNNNMI
jgi:hypothetical protein